MTETNTWRTIRRELAPFGQLLRVETTTAAGVPDVLYSLRGVAGFIELKSTIETLSLEQILFAERWTAAGMPCHMLVHADNTWLLYDAAGMRACYAEHPATPVARAEGKFPLREILDALAPRR